LSALAAIKDKAEAKEDGVDDEAALMMYIG